MNQTSTKPTMSTAARLSSVIGPYLAAEGLELDDLHMLGQGGRRILRVVVDAEGGLTVDRLAETSRLLSRLLNDDPDLQTPYRLEVTTPGLERPLKTPRQFEKSTDREVVLKVRTDGGANTLRGRLMSANERECELSVEGERHRLDYGAIISARTVFRWQAAPKPGKKR